MALDVGLRRIGLAKCVNGIILPLEVVWRKNRNQAAHAINQIIKQNNPKIIVVGIPMDGSCFEVMKKRIEHFIGLIGIPDSIELVYIDESWSSIEASEKTKVIKGKKYLDSIAACIILERFNGRGRE